MQILHPVKNNLLNSYLMYFSKKIIFTCVFISISIIDVTTSDITSK